MNAPAFNVKSAQLMLVALVLNSPHADDLAQQLAEHLNADPDFFRGQGVLLDLQHLHAENTQENTDKNDDRNNETPQENPPPLDFSALSQTVEKYGMRLIAVRSGHPQHMQAAAAAGLICAPDLPKNKSKKTAPDNPQPNPNPPTDHRPAAIIRETVREIPVEVPVVRPTLVVERTLRSGQQLYARDAHLVLIGAVSAGAEVIADGDVHVYGPLRGRAVAGARGQTSARIFSTQMQPQLLSIAGNYRAFEDGLPSDVDGQAAQSWLDDSEKLLLAPLHAKK